MAAQLRISSMDQKLYLAATEGDTEFLFGKTSEYFLGEVTPKGNTAAHIAARFGNSRFVATVLLICPDLLVEKNANGDTPLHVAARGGFTHLVRTIREAVHPSGEILPLKLKNEKGDTALHESVKNGWTLTSLLLLAAYPGAASEVNDAGESPLFIASEFGLEIVVQNILEKHRDASSQGRMGMNALHGAAGTNLRTAYRIVNLLTEARPELNTLIDDHGRTALHYAATNSLEVCDLLLRKDHSIANIPDMNGLTPFMIAIQALRLKTALKILDYSPDCAEIQDLNGCNALHYLVKFGRYKSIEALLHRVEIQELINEADKDGNTPLHLATIYNYYHAVRILIKHEGVLLNVRNKAGWTPMDIADEEGEFSIRKIRIWRALTAKRAQRSRPNKNSIFLMLIFNHPQTDLKSIGKTVIIVATLLATVTFTAVFTVPGGYNQNDGTAILSKSAAFMVFIISDTIAFLCSLSIMINLIMGFTGDPCFLKTTANLTWVLTMVAFLATLVAFLTAIYATLSKNCPVLATIPICISCIIPFFIGWIYNYSAITSPLDRLWLEKKYAIKNDAHPSQSNNHPTETANGSSADPLEESTPNSH